MPVYQYEGVHYDLPDGLTNEQAISKIESHLGKTSKVNTPSALDSVVAGAKGTAAAVADIGSGFVKLPAQALLAVGGKIADPSQSLQTSWESAGNAVEDTFPSFGKDMQDNMGYKAPMTPFELYGKGAEYIADKASMGNKDVQGAINVGANFLPIPFAGKAGRLAGKVIENVDPGLRNTNAPKSLGPNTAGLAETLTKPEIKVSSPLPDNIPQGSPIERMRQQLGGEAPGPEPTAMSRMADTLTERSTAEQRAAQDLLESRQKELELAVKKQATLDTNASQRARQEAAGVVSDAHKALMDAQETARIAKDSERMGNATQPEMFEGLDHGYGPNPHDIGGKQHWAVDENGIPIRADLSMEAANLENPLQRNLWGDELGQKHEQEAPSSLTQAIDKMDSQPWHGDARDAALSTLKGLPLGSAARKALFKKQGGGLLIGERKKPQAEDTWYTASPSKGRTATYTLESQSSRANANEQFAGPGHYITLSKDLASVYGGPDGRMYSVSKPFEKAYDLTRNKEEYHKLVKSSGSKVAANRILKENGYDAITFTDPRGNKIANIFNERELTDVGPAREPVKDFGELTLAPKGTPFNFKNQGGGVRLDWTKDKEQKVLKGIPGLKDKIGDLLPDTRPIEQFLKEEASTPDVQQNWMQKVANYGTKGSLYQAIKTQNPLVKRVGDTIRDANNKARSQIAEYVHAKLAPAAQALSKSEKTDIFMAQQLAEATGKPLTPEILKEHGFNQKQIDWFTTHKEVMDFALGKINEATSIAGEAPVTPRVAYLASRASGDFRRLIYTEINGEKSPVAILGADTRSKLDSDVARLQKEHPEWIVGDERYYGGSSKQAKGQGLAQAIELLAKNDPNVKLLAEHVNDLLTKDAYDYMNAKSHTMAKKGIAGMSGRKLFTDAETNTREGMQAQINYAEKIIQWAEMSRAVAEVKPLLKEDNGLNMPNAKQWSKDYIEQALGNNPSSIGRAIDSVFSEIGRKAGIGPSVGNKVLSASRKITNGLLLGFGNIGFLGANLIQPFKSSPEMFALLKGRGLEKTFDAGTGYSYLGKAINYAWKDLAGKEIPPHIKEALNYAKENHVYSSDLFDASNGIDKGIAHYWDKGTQFGASAVEMRTRQIAYLSYVDLLHENGLTKKDGLYEAAQNLTDLQMNNYATSEAPRMYNELGSVGTPAYNLMSYKHNEYSRLAMLVNEMGRSGTATPLLVNLASSIAFAGVMGTIGYTEADALVKLISKQLKTPTSLTKILLENPNIPDQLKYGGGATLGIDLTNRLGTGPLTPQSPIDAIMPGAGKLVTAAGAIGTAVTSPSEYNTKNALREVAPNSISGLIDRAWFSGKDAKGNELAINRNKATPTATRNETDKALKTISMTGINEAKQKSLNYENDSITRAYGDIRNSLVDKATKEYFMSGKLPADFAKKYITAQGDPSSLERELTNIAVEQKMDAKTYALLRNSMSNSLTTMHKTLRMVGKE